MVMGFERSSVGTDTAGTGSPSKPMLAVVTNRCGGVSSVTASARRVPTTSANWASMKVVAVTKSGASEMAESISARRSPLSCGLVATVGLSCGRLATSAVSRFKSLKPPLQICIFRPHPIELLCSTCGQFTRTRSGKRHANRFRVLEISLDGRDDDTRFDCHEVDTYEGDSNPCVDDDAFVEYAIENIDKRAAARGTFNCHVVTPVVLLPRRVVLRARVRPSLDC